jgi:uncharacterized MAPEG superfamily protein
MVLQDSPAFYAYAAACVALCGNLIYLWAYSGIVRNELKSTPNPEDVSPFGAKLSDTEPAAIARVLRAHANAQAIILPFLVLGLVYVLMGGSQGAGIAYFSTFTVARWLHSWAYLGSRQPLRTLFFIIGALPLLALLGHVVWLLLSSS